MNRQDNTQSIGTDIIDSHSTPTLEAVIEDFLEKHRKGERPDMEQFISRYPALEEDIRDTLPALLMLEKVDLREDSLTNNLPDNAEESLSDIQIGDYRIVRELGRGGMGVVYEAEQISLGRRVALKVLPSQSLSDEIRVSRFQREAQAAARLHHTNIVPVFEVGQEGEHTFYAMQYIEGRSLDTVIGGLTGPTSSLDKTLANEPIEPSAFYRSITKLIHQIAEALAHAHARGIIHRDIKPSNLILDGNGQLWLTDFGLAKTEEQGLTQTGDVLGTIHYMSPERFQGQCDARADIYSLGLTLYELLTLRSPFPRGERGLLINMIQAAEPIRPQSIDPRIPTDLETICLKCIEKAPSQRYATAHELAQDLERFFHGEPIKARPLNVFERTWRWGRRYPGRVASIFATSIALLSVVGILVALAYQSQLNSTNTQLSSSLDRESKLSTQLRIALTQSEKARDAERVAKEKLDEILYSRRISLALSEWLEGAAIRARELLQACPEKFRHWEWHYLKHVFYPEQQVLTIHNSEVRNIKFSPDGNWMVSAGENGLICIHEASTGKVIHQLHGHAKGVTDLIFSVDSTQLISTDTDGTIQIHDVVNGVQLQRLPKSTPLRSLALSPDGRYIVCGGYQQFKVVNTTTFNVVRTIRRRHSAWVSLIQFQAEGTQLLTMGIKEINIWSVPKWKLLRSISLHHENLVRSPVLSPDGKLAAYSSREGRITLVDIATGKNRLQFQAHRNLISDLAFNSDCTLIASCGADGSVKIHDVAKGRLLRNYQGHQREVKSVCFSPNDTQVVSGGQDQSIRFWNSDESPEAQTIQDKLGNLRGVAISPDGKQFAYGTKDRAVIRAIPSLKKIHEVGGFKEFVRSLAYSADGRTLALGGAKSLRVIDTTTWEEKQLDSSAHSSGVFGLSFSPNGQRLASAGGLAVCIHDLTTGERLHQFQCHFPLASGVYFIDHGKKLITSGYDKLLKVHDAETGALLHTLTGHTGMILTMRLSPSGRLLATGCDDGTIRLWDLNTLKMRTTFSTRSDGIVGLTFTPDEQRVISGGSDETIRIWNLVKEEQVILFKRQPMPIHSLEITPDGRQLIRLDSSQQVIIWNAPTFTNSRKGESEELTK